MIVPLSSIAPSARTKGAGRRGGSVSLTHTLSQKILERFLSKKRKSQLKRAEFIICPLSRILDHKEVAKKAQQEDVEEGKNIKQQVDMYEVAKKTIEEQRRKVC